MAFLCSQLQVAVETQSKPGLAGIQIGGAVECCCLPPDTQARIQLLFRTGSGQQAHRGHFGQQTHRGHSGLQTDYHLQVSINK